MNRNNIFHDINVIYDSLQYLHKELGCPITVHSILNYDYIKDCDAHLDFSLTFNERDTFIRNVNLNFFPKNCQKHIMILKNLEKKLSIEEAEFLYLIFQNYNIFTHKEDSFLDALQKIVTSTKRNFDNTPFLVEIENYLLSQKINENNPRKTTFKV